MRIIHKLVPAVVALAMISTALAQETPEIPSPTKEHQFLQQFVGDWESESEVIMAPGQPGMKCKGTASSRMLGGFWVVTESHGEMMGTKVKAIQTIGYDPAKKKYIGTWVDSMMNHMWEYDGSVDETGKKITLEAEGPNFVTPGKTAKFRDVYDFKSQDHIEATSFMQGEDGKWIQFMTGQIRRKK